MIATIVTGTTRGLGRSLAAAVTERGRPLYSLSSAAGHSRKQWKNWQCDLSRGHEVARSMDQVMDAVATDSPDEVVLINNAGILSPVGPLENATVDQIVTHLMVNQAAPAVLMSRFIRRSRSIAPQRRIINISSGAARDPYHGWALYCASKSAVDMVTRCAATEQLAHAHPVSICSVYPGKVDTGMQRQIRHSDPAQFPDRAAFVQAKARGALLPADAVARMIIALDESGHLKNGGVYDIRATRIDSQGQVTGLQQIVAPLADDAVRQP